jgi:L-ectoine synthase
MIVRRLHEVAGTERDVASHSGTWVSRRFLLRDDGLGFSFHDTTIYAGTETRMWYRHHLEAVYCVAGEGELEDLETGMVHPISDGTMYALNGHERHIVRAWTDLRMICVFNPPLTGREDHDADGVYPLPEPAVTPSEGAHDGAA